MTQRSRKALVIGAGIAGPITAIFLKGPASTRKCSRLALFDRIGGGLQLAPNGMHVLAEAVLPLR